MIQNRNNNKLMNGILLNTIYTNIVLELETVEIKMNKAVKKSSVLRPTMCATETE